MRLHDATGDPRYRRAADGAARAVMHHKWRIGLAYCHGLAGNGDFLLDLRRALPPPGRRTLPRSCGPSACGVAGVTCSATSPARSWRDFNVGLGGILAFLLRLRLGGSRMWLVDEVGR